MWFLKPKHTVRTVARQIRDGLNDGTITLEAETRPEEPTAETTKSSLNGKSETSRPVVPSNPDGSAIPSR